MTALALAAIVLLCLALSWFAADRLFAVGRTARPDPLDLQADQTPPEAP